MNKIKYITFALILSLVVSYSQNTVSEKIDLEWNDSASITTSKKNKIQIPLVEGQFVDDNIWMYIKDTTNKWDADNRINHGVSKDLVAQVLRDMGVKLYQNMFKYDVCFVFGMGRGRSHRRPLGS